MNAAWFAAATRFHARRLRQLRRPEDLEAKRSHRAGKASSISCAAMLTYIRRCWRDARRPDGGKHVHGHLFAPGGRAWPSQDRGFAGDSGSIVSMLVDRIYFIQQSVSRMLGSANLISAHRRTVRPRMVMQAKLVADNSPVGAAKAARPMRQRYSPAHRRRDLRSLPALRCCSPLRRAARRMAAGGGGSAKASSVAVSS